MALKLNFQLKEGKTIGIIGLGRFGSACAEALADHVESLILIDLMGKDLTRPLSPAVMKKAEIKEVDCTDEKALKEVGLNQCELVIVAIGENIEANILTAVNLIGLEVPYIIAKANNELQRRLLERVGVHLVIFPEQNAAKVLAAALKNDNPLNIVQLGDDSAIQEIPATDKVAGKNLRELDIRQTYGVNVVALKTEKGAELIEDGKEIIQINHTLVVVGKLEKLNQFRTFLQGG